MGRASTESRDLSDSGEVILDSKDGVGNKSIDDYVIPLMIYGND